MSKNIKILLFELAMIIGKSDFEYPIFIVYLIKQRIIRLRNCIVVFDTSSNSIYF